MHPKTGQELEFYAFTLPRQGTQQLALWGRLGDAVDAAYRPLQGPMLVKLVGPQESLHPGRPLWT